MPAQTHPNLIVGFEHGSDAGVYRLGPDQALVQSVDFFTPIVDDPRTFGEIAAANALSDLYAMGARPLTALALAGFPEGDLDPAILGEILAGGAAKVAEAGAVIVGGHSVRDPELKYGLAVTGVVHPDALRTNQAARAGDALVLTKPLGSGLIGNAIKAGKVTADDPRVAAAIDAMRALNAAASEVLARHGVRAATDVTGFGLIGHALEMARASGVGLELRPAALPVFELGLELAGRPLAGGSKDNQDAFSPEVERRGELPEPQVRLAFDAQTSGGLLAAVPAAALEAVVRELGEAGTHAAAVVGRVTAEPRGRVVLVP